MKELLFYGFDFSRENYLYLSKLINISTENELTFYFDFCRFPLRGIESLDFGALKRTNVTLAFEVGKMNKLVKSLIIKECVGVDRLTFFDRVEKIMQNETDDESYRKVIFIGDKCLYIRCDILEIYHT